jgi:hypothetical protein
MVRHLSGVFRATWNEHCVHTDLTNLMAAMILRLQSYVRCRYLMECLFGRIYDVKSTVLAGFGLAEERQGRSI